MTPLSLAEEAVAAGLLDYDAGIPLGQTDSVWRETYLRDGTSYPYARVCCAALFTAKGWSITRRHEVVDSQWTCTLRKGHAGGHVGHQWLSGMVAAREYLPHPALTVEEGL